MKFSSLRLHLALGIPFLGLGALVLITSAETQTPETGTARQVAAGKQSFINHCAACHGEDGRGGALGPSLLDVQNPRATSKQAVHDIVLKGILAAGMPAFKLAAPEVDSLAVYVMSLKAPSGASAVRKLAVATAGDVKAGFDFLAHEGKCLSCHAVSGRGGVVGPDLSNLARTRTAEQIQQSLTDPGSLPLVAAGGGRRGGGEGGLGVAPASYAAATVKLRNGRTVHGALKNETPFDLQLQGVDGKLYLFSKDQVADVVHEKQSLMPKTQATPEQMKNLVAYLTRLSGEMKADVPLPSLDLGAGVPIAQVEHPKSGEWPTYNGNVSGNRFSPLNEINTKNVAQIVPKWSFTLPGAHRALENTPVVVDGVMYVTASNECYALDARTGRQIWHYGRPRTKDLVPTGDAASGINRGVAVLGDRVFMVTDNARLIALQRFTGTLVWDVEMADYKQNYGATQAPLVVGDFVISGISGGDEGVRGFLSAYKASTGERVWRFWTTSLAGEPASETWVGTSLQHPGASTWMTGTYDPVAKILYWGIGNPGPDHNGDQRKGDNLYSCSIVALDPLTGKLIWYRQLTPHNLHDWDSTQTPMLVDAPFHGKPRKLLLQANRNGFFYVLDRLTGEFLLGAPFINSMSWASGVDRNGRPILKGDSTPTYEGTRVCPRRQALPTGLRPPSIRRQGASSSSHPNPALCM